MYRDRIPEYQRLPTEAMLRRANKLDLTMIARTLQINIDNDNRHTKNDITNMIVQRCTEIRQAEAEMHRERENQLSRIAKEENDFHRQTRNTSPRAETNPDIGKMQYPFQNLEEYGGPQQIFRPILGQPEMAEDVAEFPTKLQRIVWIHEGCNDEEPWKMVAQLSNGKWIFYKAECDYTGFDCQGSMQLFAAADLSTLIDLAMDIRDYDQWIGETQPE